MTTRPEPHRDQQTIGSWKKTINAAVLIYVNNRTRQPAPQRLLPVRRLLAGATITAALVALGVDPSALPGLN